MSQENVEIVSRLLVDGVDVVPLVRDRRNLGEKAQRN
jgi:hypothetical protein